jgi:hypothetical protein
VFDFRGAGDERLGGAARGDGAHEQPVPRLAARATSAASGSIAISRTPGSKAGGDGGS